MITKTTIGLVLAYMLSVTACVLLTPLDLRDVAALILVIVATKVIEATMDSDG